MKQGKSLSELAREIERQAQAKIDYIADTTALRLADVPSNTPTPPSRAESIGLELMSPSGAPSTILPITALGHRQIGDRVGIPAKYYERMLVEAPELLAVNVNHWFRTVPEKRLIRTLDGKVRAFLSNRYHRIDNVHVAEAVLPVLAETPGVEVVSSEITERRLYIKAVTHKVRAEVKSKRVGDLVEAGVMISNSEVGLGAVTVTPFFYFLACLNGMLRPREGLRSAHLGTRLSEEDAVAQLFADDTRRAVDRSILLKVRDVVRAALDETRFRAAIDQMVEQTTQPIRGNPAAAIEVLGDELGLHEQEKSGVLRYLIEGGDLSRYGVMNAVTRTAEDADSYDRATELEAAGGQVLDMSRSVWERIATAV